MLVYSLSLFIHENQKSHLKIEEFNINNRLNKFEQKIESVRELTPVVAVPKPKPEGLEAYKEIGGTGTYINPITKKQEVMAFAQTFNSTRYEVSTYFTFLLFIFYSFLLNINNNNNNNNTLF